MAAFSDPGTSLNSLYDSHLAMRPATAEPEAIKEEFRRLWEMSTDDNNITLYGFRRFKTTHLLNLRLLEDEIANLDHEVYQAGLGLRLLPSSTDRLGLRHSKLDSDVPSVHDTFTRDFVLSLRGLVKEYGTWARRYP